MRLSPNRLAAASTVVAALLLAACAGHGAVPASGAFAPSAPDAVAAKTPAPKKTPGPCATPSTQTPWVFNGECAFGVLPPAPKVATASMPIYHGLIVKAIFTTTTGLKPNTVLVVRDAIGKGDVTGKFDKKLMPPFNAVGTTGQTTTVSPLIYLKVHNEGSGFTFNGIPQITITTKSPFPKNTVCFLTQMNTSNYTWVQSPVLTSVIKGNLVEFGTLSKAIAVPKGGTIYIAAACKF